MTEWMSRSRSPKGDEVGAPPDQDRTGRRNRPGRGNPAAFLQPQNVMVKSASRSRSPYRPRTASDAPSTQGTLSTGVLGRPNLQNPALQQPDQNSSLVADLGDVGDPRPHSLRNRARPNYQETGDTRKVTLARFALRAFFTVIGAVAGGAAGSLLGGLGGATVGSVIPVGGTIGGLTLGAAGGIVGGALVGGAAGWAIADRIIASWLGNPQDKHLKDATDSLIDKGCAFTPDEIARLENVEKHEWRRLLHVPSSKGKYTPFEGSGRVKDPTRRKKIREALVRHVAMTGSINGADRLKQRLIKAAVLDRDDAERARKENRPSPAKDAELNRRIAEDRVTRIYASLGLGSSDVRERGREESTRAAREERNDETISRNLVEAAAANAASLSSSTEDNRKAHTHAVGAIVAHAARYARSPGEFMTGDYPGARALGKIFKRYDGDTYQTETLHPVRKQVMQSDDRDANLNRTMKALVGKGNQKEVVGKLPGYWPRLLRNMAEAARTHAPTSEDRERYARLAVLRGLTGASLSPPLKYATHAAERLRDNARRVEKIFAGAGPNQLRADQKQDDPEADWDGPVSRFMKEIKDERYDQQARDAALRQPDLGQIPSGAEDGVSDLDLDQGVPETESTRDSQTTQSSHNLETPRPSDTEQATQRSQRSESVETSDTNDGKRSPSESDSG